MHTLKLYSHNYAHYLVLILAFSFLTLSSYAQTTIRHPKFDKTDCPLFHLDSIQLNRNSTLLYCTYYNQDGVGAWANINRGMKLIDKDNSKTYNIVKIEGLPFSPDRKTFTYETKVSIVLEFANIGNATNIDLHEGEQSAFNIYGINLHEQCSPFDIINTLKIDRLSLSFISAFESQDNVSIITIGNELSPILDCTLGSGADFSKSVHKYMFNAYSVLGNKSKAIEQLKDYVYGEERCQTDGLLDLVLHEETLAFMLAEYGDMKQAICFMNNSIANRENNEMYQTKEISTKQVIAGWYLEQKDTLSAIRLYEDSKTEYINLQREYEPIYYALLNTIAPIYNSLGDQEKCISTYQELSENEIRGGLSKSIQHAITLNILANEYERRGDVNQAISENLSALDVLKNINAQNDDCYKNVVSSLAHLYSELKDYERCKSMLTERLLFDNSKYGNNSNEYVKSLSHCVSLLCGMGRYGEAIEYAEMEQKLVVDFWGKESLQYKSALEDLILCNEYIGNKDYAEIIKKELSKLSSNDSTSYQTNDLCFNATEWTRLYNLSIDYNDKNPELSINYAEKALKLTEGFAEARTLRVGSLVQLGGLCSKYINPSIANNYIEEAIIIQKDLNEDCEDMAMLYSLYDINKVSASGNYQEINVDYHKHYWSFIKNRIVDNFLFLTEKERAMYWKKAQSYFLSPIMLSALADMNNDANIIEYIYDYCLFTKSLIMQTARGIDELVENTNDVALKKKYEDYKNNNSYLNDNSKEREFIKASRIYGDYKSKLSVSWKDIKEALKDNEIAIEMFRQIDQLGVEQYTAILLRKNWEHPRMAFIGYACHIIESQSLNAVLPAWNRLIDVGEIKNGDTIYLALDGGLNKYGFEHVLNDNGELISDVYNVIRVSSTREVTNQRSTKPIQMVALFGGLNYDLNVDKLPNSFKHSNNNEDETSLRSSDFRSGFDNLPNSREEVLAINKLLIAKNIDSQVYSEAKGTEDEVINLSNSNTDIIHFATHGSFVEDEETAKRNNLTFVENNSTVQSLGYDTSSLSRSFLVMSGGNMLPRHIEVPKGANDGILTAKEIARLNLSHVDLVVLSACKSGAGDVYDEGVMGLQYGFKKAGVKSILMSLDNVDDKATQLLMVEFYKNLLSGKSKHDSLRDAQRYLRTTENGKYSDPKYWASFIMLDGI